MVAADFMFFVRRVHGRINEEKFTYSPLKQPVKRRERETERENSSSNNGREYNAEKRCSVLLKKNFCY